MTSKVFGSISYTFVNFLYKLPEICLEGRQQSHKPDSGCGQN